MVSFFIAVVFMLLATAAATPAAAAAAATAGSSPPPPSMSSYVRVMRDDGGHWWFHVPNPAAPVEEKTLFLSLGVNHVNNGNPTDDGVGGVEALLCKSDNITGGGPLCGDTLSFAPKLQYSPYYNTSLAKYGSEEQWSIEAVRRLSSWGFNTIGGWSAVAVENVVEQQIFPRMYYVHLLDMLTTWLQHRNLPDIFGSEFYSRAFDIAKKECSVRKLDKFLIGYQTDNELPWTKDFLMQYLENDNEKFSSGHSEAIKFLRSTYHLIDDLNVAWNIHAASFDDVSKFLHDVHLNKTRYGHDSDDFTFEVVSHYFNVCKSAILSYDPNHLLIGDRASSLNDAAVRAEALFVDVLDVHSYATDPPISTLQHYHALSGKPIILGEFSFTSVDSNMPNTKGARHGIAFATQTERADAYRRYVTTLISQPFVVGYHWWQYADEPATGRWPDLEDSNYGLVHIDDDEYQVLTGVMTSTNAKLEQLHLQSHG